MFHIFVKYFLKIGQINYFLNLLYLEKIQEYCSVFIFFTKNIPLKNKK